ncbi:MAG: LytTR family DNA-binding domain-containing protein [Acidobacteriota bacterium]|nr:LytTR family DNA-binding domain-containing protein [Acidobacteriota bacterium]
MRERAASTLSAVIVDDEPLASGELAFLLKDFPDVELVATGRNGLEALTLIEKFEPDLAFLDVQMPGLDGLGVVRQLRERQPDYLPYFIFSTAFEQYAVEAFRLEALDYVLKPVDKARLAETIERAQRYLQERNAAPTEPSAIHPKLMVRCGTRNLIVDTAELVYATIDNGVISLVTQALEGQSNYKTLDELQANLDPNVFWRTHRSFVVNINQIREVVPWFNAGYQLRMSDKKNAEIPVSRVQTRRLRELLKL